MEQAFDGYVRLVLQETARLRADAPSRKTLNLIRNRDSELSRIVESLEESPAFGDLVRASQSVLRGDFHNAKSDDRWTAAVQHFFRRGGLYFRSARTEGLRAQDAFKTYIEAFEKREVVVRYLAPVEFVSFSKDEVNCGSFRIRRFSKSELDEILQVEINRAFYPPAAADTARLCRYWFLVVQTCRPAEAISTRISADLSGIGSVGPSHHPPPRPIEGALRVLSLFDWEQATPRYGEVPGGWVRVGLPIVLTIEDALLSDPDVVPSCSVLEAESVYAPGREPVYADLEDGPTTRLEQFAQSMASQVAEYPAGHPWHFFEIAMNYFVRAFQTDGVDQLLWHIIALEALAGDERGVRKSVSDRLTHILGQKESAQFRTLYKTRSDLVHGNVMVRSVAAADMLDLRQLARRTILWFANCLAHFGATATARGSAELPTRKQLLQLLDLSDDGRLHLRKHLDALPKGFPRVSAWSG